MKRNFIFITMLLTVLVCGCSKTDFSNATFKDGVYTGSSSESTDNDGGGHGEITITIENGEIVDVVYDNYDTDGTIKGEDYGKINGEISNQDYYDKAQKARLAAESYANQLLAVGDPDKIDAISGATISYDQVVEAATEALLQAIE